ncbi:MAG: hypothetical protein SR1Q7_01565 [Quinella sp. 1Q7]|nr:hypothetical protein [Quinella sp. 1Q7]
MFKRTVAAIIILAAMLCTAVKVDAADTPRHTKDDTWLIYMYICGADLEEVGHAATGDIAEMQHVNLPPNVKVLIAAGGAKVWHHPTIAAGGEGIYLYGTNGLTKQVDWHANMGDPSTLAQFLQYGEENFAADHKVIIFWDHGGLSGLCFDGAFEDGQRYYMSYDGLKNAFTAVYGNAPENPPFELIGFDLCVSASYELADSIANFSRYMIGSEPSTPAFGWDYTYWLNALSKDASVNGAQLGKIISDGNMKYYKSQNVPRAKINTYSVIDLTKMPELREAYEAYFDEAAARSKEYMGFSGAFARAAYAPNVDKYSNWYVDLGVLAKNTKSIMPDASEKLLKTIDQTVVYQRQGRYLKSKGISTYYPYVSPQRSTISTEDNDFADRFMSEDSSYAAQKELYNTLLGLNTLQDGAIPVELNSNGHLVAKLEPEQMGNISMTRCIIFPVTKSKSTFGHDIVLGGAVLISVDDLKVDWKKGIVTEKFRATEPVFDGHRIVTIATVSGRGHNFYEVPIIHNDKVRVLQVRYDTSAKKYEIVGFGSEVENGMVTQMENQQLRPGDIITPIHMIITAEESVDPDDKTIIAQSVDPETGKIICLKLVSSEPFVYTHNSAITDRKIARGNYFYGFSFRAPNGQSAVSRAGYLRVKYGKVTRSTQYDDSDEDDLE